MPPLDGCDGMELFLNLLWLAIATAAVLTAPRRSRRVSFAIGCALALLFPIVSVSDDLLAGHESSEEALAIVVRRYFLSSVGDDAAYKLGCYALDRHDFVGASRLFTKILERHPDPSMPRPTSCSD